MQRFHLFPLYLQQSTNSLTSKIFTINRHMQMGAMLTSLECGDLLLTALEVRRAVSFVILIKRLALSGRRIQRNVYYADLSRQSAVKSITGLKVNGKRAIRARYPNADPGMSLPFSPLLHPLICILELQFYPDGFIHDVQGWGPVFKFPKAVTMHVDQPNRNKVTAEFGEYSIGTLNDYTMSHFN